MESDGDYKSKWPVVLNRKAICGIICVDAAFRTNINLAPVNMSLKSS